MQRVVLTQAQKDEYNAIDLAVPPKIMDRCAQCGRGIPHGYLALVTKWTTVVWGSGYVVHKPAEMYCRDCGLNVSLSGRRGTPKTPANAREKIIAALKTAISGSSLQQDLLAKAEELGINPEEWEGNEMSAKEIAVRLLEAVDDEPHGSKLLARKIGAEDVQEKVLLVLKRLRDAGKVIFVDGKWTAA
jgi:hypothetical protein